MVRKIAGEHNVESKARKFTVWSHVVSLIFAQISRAVSFNDVCDNMQMHRGELSSVRGATPPSPNTLSHANRTGNADMAQTLFWKVLAHLQAQAGTAATLQTHHLCGRFDHDPTGGKLHGLGKAPASQSCGQKNQGLSLNVHGDFYPRRAVR
ncbi:MAG: DUF4372 domain-containing protein [Verrucomicrobiae bacterium]|nr:DUF4372 domain-containing protein [Verrucomicrobiae bacterium]